MQEVNAAQDATINRRLTLVRHERRLTLKRDKETGVVEKDDLPSAAAALNFTFGDGLPSILSGYTSGICGLLVGHPFDSLKVLLQAPPQQQQQQQINMNNSKSKILITTASSIPANSSKLQKLRSLYAGIGPPMLTIGLIQSINFFCFDALRRALYYTNTSHEHGNANTNNTSPSSLDYLYQDTIWNVLLSSAITGSLLSIITSPLQVLKTQQQLNPTWTLRHIIQQQQQSSGKTRALMKVLYVAYPCHLFCEIIGRSTYFGSYEFIKRRFSSSSLGSLTSSRRYELSLTDRMMCASAAGILSWSVIYPMDVVRTNMYARQSRKINGNNATSSIELSSTARSMIHQMYKSGGIRAFFRGYTLTIIRAGPVAAVVLPVYDLSLLWFHNVLQ